jgi:hypothetical protein
MANMPFSAACKAPKAVFRVVCIASGAKQAEEKRLKLAFSPKRVLQGLKPEPFFCIVCGPAKAVPCYKARLARVFPQPV